MRRQNVCWHWVNLCYRRRSNSLSRKRFQMRLPQCPALKASMKYFPRLLPSLSYRLNFWNKVVRQGQKALSLSKPWSFWCASRLRSLTFRNRRNACTSRVILWSISTRWCNSKITWNSRLESKRSRNWLISSDKDWSSFLWRPWCASSILCQSRARCWLMCTPLLKITIIS